MADETDNTIQELLIYKSDLATAYFRENLRLRESIELLYKEIGELKCRK